MDSLGEKIRLLLKAKSLKQKDLAERLGIKPSSVNQWIKGTARPDNSRLAQIAKELGVTVDSLLSNENAQYEITTIGEEPTSNLVSSKLSDYERLQYELRIKELELEMERRVSVIQSELLVYKEKELAQQQKEIERQRALSPDQDAINK
ncbi:helix-turn-helix domain-containing protein [Spirosoma telluris]|uniref:helix-turn-helix domain-containing protein n=1 Tax=Spirosoma telluris TaxID=2183553 RepID=UPI0012FB5401